MSILTEMLEPRTIEPNLQKLRAAVHYICHRKRDRPADLSKTKLHKILFYSDIESYLKRREAITGERYIKRQYGPCSTHLDSILAELAESGTVITTQKEFEVGGEAGLHNLYFSAVEPDLSLFSAEEISLIDEWIEKICRLSARRVSDLSHDIVWESRDMWDEIPYYSGFLYSLGEIRPQDMAWAQAQLERRAQK